MLCILLKRTSFFVVTIPASPAVITSTVLQVQILTSARLPGTSQENDRRAFVGKKEKAATSPIVPLQRD